ncbi:hypothetical protein D3C81_1767770 [compost metagenome]
MKATGIPTWCSAAIEAGMSLAFLIASMRVSSGAIGLEPSASTAASFRPLAQKSPSSFCTLPCGLFIERSSSWRCWLRALSASWLSAVTAPVCGTGLALSQLPLVSS